MKTHLVTDVGIDEVTTATRESTILLTVKDLARSDTAILEGSAREWEQVILQIQERIKEVKLASRRALGWDKIEADD